MNDHRPPMRDLGDLLLLLIGLAAIILIVIRYAATA